MESGKGKIGIVRGAVLVIMNEGCYWPCFRWEGFARCAVVLGDKRDGLLIN